MTSGIPIQPLLAESNALGNVGLFLKAGGAFMLPILACSLVAVALVVHRALSLRREAVIPRGLERRLEDFRQRGGNSEFNALAREAATGRSPMARLAVRAMEMRGAERPAVEAAVESAARLEVVRLQWGLAMLEVIVTISPLLGLLGTVSGLVQVFGVFSGTGGEQADPMKIAAGIAEALYATIGGLVVAIPVVIAHSYLSKKVESLAVRMELLAGQLIHGLGDLYRRAGGAAEPPPAPLEVEYSPSRLA